LLKDLKSVDKAEGWICFFGFLLWKRGGMVHGKRKERLGEKRAVNRERRGLGSEELIKKHDHRVLGIAGTLLKTSF